MGRTEVFAQLRARPVRLTLARPAPPPPLALATEVLQLAKDTPFPVEVHYLDEPSEVLPDQFKQAALLFSTERHRQGMGPEQMLLELGARLVLEVCRTADDCALVFLPGIAEIEHFQKML